MAAPGVPARKDVQRHRNGYIGVLLIAYRNIDISLSEETVRTGVPKRCEPRRFGGENGKRETRREDSGKAL